MSREFLKIAEGISGVVYNNDAGIGNETYITMPPRDKHRAEEFLQSKTSEVVLVHLNEAKNVEPNVEIGSNIELGYN